MNQSIPDIRSSKGLGMRFSKLFLLTVFGASAVGFLVGLDFGVPKIDQKPVFTTEHQLEVNQDAKLIPAVSYADIPSTAMGPTAVWRLSEKKLPSQAYDLFAEIKPNPDDKLRSSAIRATRRAFNGAPPIIPHSIEGTNDSACYACHAQGMRLAGLKASVMSHGYLANCTQCHASGAPAPFEHWESLVDSSFVGLPAPKEGKRAFPGAPPTIPHSQWMRENCNACHGGPNGWAGMESTHPWRFNCTQCHAPSAALDQVAAIKVPPMLPPLDVIQQ